MSIIYDALKKVEESKNKNQNSKIDKEHKSKHKIYLLPALVLCLGLFIANIFFNLFTSSYRDLFKKNNIYLKDDTKSLQNGSNILVKDQTQTEKTQNIYTESPKEISPFETNLSVFSDTKRQLRSSLVLNGVFFSENQGCALINNRILKEGDIIEGATVKRITIDEVELEFEGSIFKLSNSTK